MHSSREQMPQRLPLASQLHEATPLRSLVKHSKLLQLLTLYKPMDVQKKLR